jgi:hypothetical protein
MDAGGKEMPRVGPGKNIRAMDLLLSLAVLAVIASPSGAQYACTTNYCVRSQSTAFQIPPGWPSVTIETCCRTRWGALPGGMDWSNGAPIMICTGNEEYATAYPNCGDPQNISQDFPLTYEKPKIGIGVAWPNGKDYRYEVESIPIIDGSDGTCAQYSTTPGKVAPWWVYELKQPQLGSYVFAASLSFRQGEKGFFAVLDNCKLALPLPNTESGNTSLEPRR